jgi:hypothetical protein
MGVVYGASDASRDTYNNIHLGYTFASARHNCNSHVTPMIPRQSVDARLRKRNGRHSYIKEDVQLSQGTS